MASLKDRKSIYYITFKQTVNSNQLEKTFSLRTKRKRVATRLKEKLESEYEKGLIDPFGNFNFLRWKHGDKNSSKVSFITLEDAISEFIKGNDNHNSKTKNFYKSLLDRFKNEVGKTMPLRNIQKKDVQKFKNIPKSRNSKNTYLTHLHSFFEWAKRNKYLEKNPASQIEMLDTKDSLSRQILKEDQLNQLIKKFKAIKTQQEEKGYIHSDAQRQLWFIPLVNTLFYSGLRISEALNLRWRDIDFTNGEIQVHNGKGNKSRTIIILLPLKRVLQKWKEKNNPKPEQLVFPSPKPQFKETKMTRRNVSRVFKRIIRKANFDDKVCIHSLRHSAATFMMREDFGVEKVKQMLGHEDLETTLKYVHLTLNDVKNKARERGLFE